MLLSIIDQKQTPEETRYLLAGTESVKSPNKKPVAPYIETIATILVYKFTDSTRRKVEAILGMRLEETIGALDGGKIARFAIV